jgi:hypothetical protein
MAKEAVNRAVHAALESCEHGPVICPASALNTIVIEL